MNRLRLSWDAFKNMMRAVARDPLWAFLALITVPFRIWKRLLGFMFILFNVTFVIGMGGGHFLEQMGFGYVVNGHDSARLISDLLGQETVLFQTMAGAIDSDKTGISYSQQHTGRLLLTPDEVRNLPAKGQLLFLAGQRPIFAEKLAYFSDPEFTGMFDPV